MNMRKFFGLLLVLMLAFVLAACGGDDDGDNGDSGDSGDSSDVELPQTITAEDPNFGGSLTVNYPEGWVAQEMGGAVALSNSQENMDTAQAATDTAPDLGDDAIFATISALGPDILGFFMDEGEEATPSTVLNATLLEGSQDEEGVEIGEIQEETLNGKSAATVVATSSGENGEGRIFGVAVEVDGGYVIIGAITAPGEEDFDDEVRAIAGGLEATFGSMDLGGADATEEMPMDEEVPADATEEAAG